MGFIDVLNPFDGYCVKCQSQLHLRHHGLCSKCNHSIRRFPYCGRCGTELTHDALSCGHCLREPPNWQRMVIIGKYVDPLSGFIHRFKFQQQFWLDRSLARLLVLAIHQARRTHQLLLPEVILPVPLHHRRQWARGYNQSNLLAHYLSHWLNIPCRQDLLVRIKHTPTQRGLTQKARRTNLKGAFSIYSDAKPFPYQRVALVDDVITTGSTLNEISHLLKSVGVQEIQVWGLAKT